MAKGSITAEELQLSQAWLKTVFFPALHDNTDYLANGSRYTLCNACKAIYNFICQKQWIDISGYISDLAGMHYKVVDERTPESGNNWYGSWYKVSASKLYKFFANICRVKQIWWEDDEHTKEEMTAFLSTPMGKTLWEFGCFISQDDSATKVNIKTPSNSAPRQQRASSGSSSGSAGSGSKLNKGNAGGLLAQDKEIINQTDMYWICGEFATPGKTKPRIHVSPINQPAPLKVKYNSGQGFDDCILYFTDKIEATAFMAKCDAAKPSTVANLEVKRVSTDPNGYFKVNTEFGEAYIKAAKLHEMLEQLEESSEEHVLEEIDESFTSIPEVTTEKDIMEAYDALCRFMD